MLRRPIGVRIMNITMKMTKINNLIKNKAMKKLWIIGLLLLFISCNKSEDIIIIDDVDSTEVVIPKLKGLTYTSTNKSGISDTIIVDLDENLKINSIFTYSSNKTSIFTYSGTNIQSVTNDHGEYMYFTYTEDTAWVESLSYDEIDSVEVYKYRYLIGDELYRYIYDNGLKRDFYKDIYYIDSLVSYIFLPEGDSLIQKKRAIRYFTYTNTKNPLYNIIDYNVWLYLNEIIDFIPIRNSEYIPSEMVIYDCISNDTVSVVDYSEIFNDMGILLQVTYLGNTYEFLYD